MGKEPDYMKKTGKSTKQGARMHKPNLLKELAHNWALPNLNSARNITENNHIFLTLQVEFSRSNFICKGFKRCDNSYRELVNYLMNEDLIDKYNNSFRIYSMKGMICTEEDSLKGKFNSGQHILVHITEKKKKPIAKIAFSKI